MSVFLCFVLFVVGFYCALNTQQGGLLRLEHPAGWIRAHYKSYYYIINTVVYTFVRPFGLATIERSNSGNVNVSKCLQ